MIRKLLAAFLVATIFSGPSPGATTTQRTTGTPIIQRPASAPMMRMGRMTPTATYYKGFVPFYDGDYATALKTFQSELRGSIKTSQSLWIDSICYETMCGECYYQMGDFDRAMFHYCNALQLYKRFPDWMMKVQFEAVDSPAQPNARKAVPWGASTRQAKLGRYRHERADHPIGDRHRHVQQSRTPSCNSPSVIRSRRTRSCAARPWPCGAWRNCWDRSPSTIS